MILLHCVTNDVKTRVEAGNPRRCSANGASKLRHMRGEHSIPDLVAADVQASEPSDFPERGDHVSARVCDEACGPTGGQALLPAHGEHVSALAGLASHQGRKEQLPAAPKSRLLRRQDRAPDAPNPIQPEGVGRLPPRLLQPQEQDPRIALQVI